MTTPHHQMASSNRGGNRSTGYHGNKNHRYQVDGGQAANGQLTMSPSIRMVENFPVHFKWIIYADQFEKWVNGVSGPRIKSPLFGTDSMKFRLHLAYDRPQNMDHVLLELVSTITESVEGDVPPPADISVLCKLSTYAKSMSCDRAVKLALGKPHNIWSTDCVFPNANPNMNKSIQCELTVTKSTMPPQPGSSTPIASQYQNVDWGVLDEKTVRDMQKSPIPPPAPVQQIESSAVVNDYTCPPEASTDADDDGDCVGASAPVEEETEYVANASSSTLANTEPATSSNVPTPSKIPTPKASTKTHIKSSTKAPNKSLSVAPLASPTIHNASSKNNHCPTTISDALDQTMVLVSNIASLRENPQFSDVSFSVGGKEFAAHKCVLAVRSPVFKAMFSHKQQQDTSSADEQTNDKPIEIEEGVDAAVFEALLNFIYSGDTSPVERYASELLTLANKYDIKGLMEVCKQHVSADITVESACNILHFAEQQQLPELKCQVMRFIEDHAGEVVATKGYQQFVKPNAVLMSQVFEHLVKQAKL